MNIENRAHYRKSLDQHQVNEADGFFDQLTRGEDEAKSEFLRLTSDTFDEIFRVIDDPSRAMLGAYTVSTLSGWSFFFLMALPSFKDVDQTIKDRWVEWDKSYQQLALRNPLVELRDMMKDISEAHDSSSWPYGWEDKIKVWVDSGKYKPFPLYLYEPYVPPEFYARLQVLRIKLGGWLYKNDEAYKYIFVKDEATK